tara:strand:+ start:707 stop:1030 length:324 start_codon:yes stop_codon:yes gene_type:complete
MLNYTLNIPQHRKVNKTNSNVVGVFDYKSIALPSELQGQHRKAYIYSRIESQDSFRHFFYAQNIVRIVVDYTKIIPQLPILFLYPLNKLGLIRQKKQLIMLVILLAV